MNASEQTGSGNEVLLKVANDPTITFRIWFKCGSQLDPKGKEGLAMLTASLMTEGSTERNPYESIVEKLYPMAAYYGSNVDREMTVISGRTHKNNLEAYYTLFTDAILQPKFDDSDFQRIKSDMLNYLEKDLRYSSDEELGKAALYNFIFKDTGYGNISEGTVEGLKSITIDDVRKFYKKYFTSDNFVIGIGGGFDDTLAVRLGKDLAALPKGEAMQPPAPKPETIGGLELFLVEKQCQATAISFGFPIGVLRGDEDFFALALFNSWFGEHRNSSSHLYQVIREARGMNYGDYSYIEAFLNGGRRQMPDPNNGRRRQIFEVWIRPVQNQNRHFALRAALRELKNVVDNGMTADQFELTKKFLYKYALHFATTTSDRLGYQIDTQFYGFNDSGDYIEYFRRKIASLTLEQVNKAIKKHLQYDNIKIAIVTQDAEKFKAELTADTPSPITYDTPKSDKVMAEDKLIEAFPLKVDPAKVIIVKVEDMFVR